MWVGLTSKAALVILGALATAFGFVMYVYLLGVHWGFRFPSVGASLGVLAGMVAVFLTYYVWKYPLSFHCAGWGTGIGLLVAYLCRGIGIKDNEETIKRQNEVRAFLDDIDGPSESGRKWRNAMKIRRTGLVFLRHRSGLYPRQQRPSRLPGSRPCGPGRSPGGSWVSS